MPIKCKVVLIGDTKVGKTCVLRRLFGESFDPTFIRTVAGGLYNLVYCQRFILCLAVFTTIYVNKASHVRPIIMSVVGQFNCDEIQTTF